MMRSFGKTFDKPFLLIHGEAGGGVPVEASVELTQKMVPRAGVHLYEGGGYAEVSQHPSSSDT